MRYFPTPGNGIVQNRTVARPKRFELLTPSRARAEAVDVRVGSFASIFRSLSTTPDFTTAGTRAPIRSEIDGKIKATMSVRAVGGRKCLFPHESHCDGTVQNASVPLQRKRHLESIFRAPPIAAWRFVARLGTMSVHDLMGGRCRTNGAPGTRVGSAAARQHAGDHSLQRAIATSRANATSIVCRDFAQITPNSAPLRLHGLLTDCAMMKECR